jgi:hypothetical protein
MVAIYPWDNDLLFLGNLRNPAKFLWLDEGGFNSEAEVESVVDSLRTLRPKLAMWIPLVRDDGSYQPIVWLSPVRSYLRQCYVPVAHFAHADAFEIKKEDQGCGIANVRKANARAQDGEKSAARANSISEPGTPQQKRQIKNGPAPRGSAPL